MSPCTLPRYCSDLPNPIITLGGDLGGSSPENNKRPILLGSLRPSTRQLDSTVLSKYEEVGNGFG